MRVRRPLAALSLAAALLAATTACSGDDPPEGDGSPSASPATSPSASSPTASTTADPPQRESAKAFIRRWNQAEATMQQTGDTAPYRELSDGCESCDRLADRVDDFYAAGGWIRWKGNVIQGMKRWGVQDGQSTWEVATVSAPTRYKESADAPVQRLPGGPNKALVVIHRTNGEWRVVDSSNLAH